MPDKVVAVILNWNCADDTLRCLRAVLAGSHVPEVVVVDNGSTDDSVARLAHLDGSATLLRLDGNLGYAGGMNAGIRAARERGADWVWLLNADAVPRPGALAALLAHRERFTVATSVQTTSAHPDDPAPEPYVVAAMLPGGRVRPFGCPGCAEGVHEVDVVTGAALLLRVADVVRVGFFDERFFHYKEEFDLVRRIADAGGRIALVCDSEVWHKRGGSLSGSSPRALYYYHRNEILYVRKHYRRPLRRLLLGEPIHYRRVATALLRLTAGGRERRLGSRAVLAGYRDGLRGVHGPTERF
ncbi:glycosyltransferase family 2 protein [Micromonospora robiginosa]|uniref:Glycosyltransferase family 2 protein n=1 Tax=Micromonospora robiginosa TaxID=2749844 RepID=A0A7L6BCG7_9ACTN|nr:glycosyltransferase family 2 protein [Micromonospora ferruginea]QLQ39588.1 glycosyltransferase family 2 protein [Micromonospora ferruginea]